MATLSQIRKSSVGAEKTLFFIEGETAGSYNLMNIRGDNSTMDTGGETEDIADVTQKVQPSEVSKYAPSMSVSQLYLTEDPVCQMFENMYRSGAVGGAAHKDIVEVHFYGANDAISAAYKADTTVLVTSFPNEAGSNKRIEATVSLSEDWTQVDESKCSYDATNGILTITA